MSSGYDLSVSTLSPDGRVFQVEYAQKAADTAPTVVAIKVKDGIIIAAARFPHSPAAVPGTNPQVFAIDKHVLAAVCGRIPDGRALVDRARAEASEFRRVWAEPIPPKVLAERLALFTHAYTLAWSERPFGACILLAGATETGDAELWAVDVSSVAYRYFGVARGSGSVVAKTELEKLDRESLTCQDVAFHLARILYKAHEEQAAERKMEIEIGSLHPSTDEDAFLPRLWPRPEADEVASRAKAAIDAEQMDDSSDDDDSNNNSGNDQQQPVQPIAATAAAQ